MATDLRGPMGKAETWEMAVEEHRVRIRMRSCLFSDEEDATRVDDLRASLRSRRKAGTTGLTAVAGNAKANGDISEDVLACVTGRTNARRRDRCRRLGQVAKLSEIGSEISNVKMRIQIEQQR